MKYSKEFVARHIFDEKGFDTGSEWKERVVRCCDCTHYHFGRCYGWGKQEHLERFSDDFCSRGEEVKHD